MNKRTEDSAGWPQRLSDSPDEVGLAMRKVARRLEAGDDEAAAFGDVQQALGRRSNRRRWTLAGRVLLLAPGVAALLLIIVGSRGTDGPGPAVPPRPSVAEVEAAPAPVVSPATVTTPDESPRVVRLARAAIRLPPGRTELADEATVVVGDGGRVTARAVRGSVTVALGAGRVDLHVRSRPSGRAFAVSAGPYRFVVVGTAFSVIHDRGSVALEVREGRVAVVQGTRTLASVTAGGWWTGPIDDHSGSPTNDRSAPSAPAPDVLPAPCAALVAAGRLRDAIACLESRASDGSGAERDVAAYQAARLWKDGVGDLERARAGFAAYRARFPQGGLRVEAALSLLEILPRLGRYQDALAEADLLLSDPATTPRRGEIHLLRGNVLRLGLGDRAGALADYRAAATGVGKIADEGAYLNAVCLEELGRGPEARAAFETYLARAAPRHAAEAQRRRDALSP